MPYTDIHKPEPDFPWDRSNDDGLPRVRWSIPECPCWSFSWHDITNGETGFERYCRQLGTLCVHCV